MSKYIDKDKVLEYIIFGVVGKDITCGELTRAIESMPTIEVSEDAISREWVLEEYQKGKEKISKTEYFDELMWLVKHAPNVVPTYQPITIKADEKDLEPLKKQLKDIKTMGTLMTAEEYGLSGCRVRTVEHAPSVVPSRAEGEWSLTLNDDYRCTACGLITSSYKANYCPHCGAKMKG